MSVTQLKEMEAALIEVETAIQQDEKELALAQVEMLKAAIAVTIKEIQK